MPFQSLGQEDTLKEGMAAHSCVLAWRIPWTEESGRLQSIGWQRVGKDFAHIVYKPMPSFRTVSSHLEKMSCYYSTYLNSTNYLDQSTQYVSTLSLSNQKTSWGLKWSSSLFRTRASQCYIKLFSAKSSLHKMSTVLGWRRNNCLPVWVKWLAILSLHHHCVFVIRSSHSNQSIKYYLIKIAHNNF